MGVPTISQWLTIDPSGGPNLRVKQNKRYSDDLKYERINHVVTFPWGMVPDLITYVSLQMPSEHT